MQDQGLIFDPPKPEGQSWRAVSVVSSSPGPKFGSSDLVKSALTAGDDIGKCLALARIVGSELPLPGRGNTYRRWMVFAKLAQQNVTAARVAEAHADALAILAEAGITEDAGTWGVFAAESPNTRLFAERSAASGWVLTGEKPWCSLGGIVTNALVSAHVGPQRQLFSVDLTHDSVIADTPDRWVARGLRTVPSASLHFRASPARPVGGPEWYLQRPGFAWGGIGVAACWLGGAYFLQDRIAEAAARRPSDLRDLALGSVSVATDAADASLRRAASIVDAQGAVGGAGELLALRVRSVVAESVERVLAVAGRILGPEPLAFDDFYARQFADLSLYVRQHHGERDIAALGAAMRTIS